MEQFVSDIQDPIEFDECTLQVCLCAFFLALYWFTGTNMLQHTHTRVSLTTDKMFPCVKDIVKWSQHIHQYLHAVNLSIRSIDHSWNCMGIPAGAPMFTAWVLFTIRFD